MMSTMAHSAKLLMHYAVIPTTLLSMIAFHPNKDANAAVVFDIELVGSPSSDVDEMILDASPSGVKFDEFDIDDDDKNIFPRIYELKTGITDLHFLIEIEDFEEESVEVNNLNDSFSNFISDVVFGSEDDDEKLEINLFFDLETTGFIEWSLSGGDFDDDLEVEVLATVPVPAALPLFFSAIACLGFLAVRRRRSST